MYLNAGISVFAFCCCTEPVPSDPPAPDVPDAAIISFGDLSPSPRDAGPQGTKQLRLRASEMVSSAAVVEGGGYRLVGQLGNAASTAPASGGGYVLWCKTIALTASEEGP